MLFWRLIVMVISGDSAKRRSIQLAIFKRILERIFGGSVDDRIDRLVFVRVSHLRAVSK